MQYFPIQLIKHDKIRDIEYNTNYKMAGANKLKLYSKLFSIGVLSICRKDDYQSMFNDIKSIKATFELKK